VCFIYDDDVVFEGETEGFASSALEEEGIR
jgi:hypothetical protein